MQITEYAYGKNGDTRKAVGRFIIKAQNQKEAEDLRFILNYIIKKLS